MFYYSWLFHLGSRLNLQAIGVTTDIYPETFADNLGEGKAENAIDGFAHIGETGGAGATYCAVGYFGDGNIRSSYLSVDLRTDWVVKAVGLFLRDSSSRRCSQYGLQVRVNAEAELENSSQCGRSYHYRRNVINPVFRCNKLTRYIWVVLKGWIQVCEIEVFGGVVGVRDKVLNSCSHPSVILDGKMTLSGLSVGSVATYQCNDRLYLIGPSQIECEATGNWSHEPPLCTSKLNTFFCFTFLNCKVRFTVSDFSLPNWSAFQFVCYLSKSVSVCLCMFLFIYRLYVCMYVCILIYLPKSKLSF